MSESEQKPENQPKEVDKSAPIPFGFGRGHANFDNGNFKELKKEEDK